MTLTYADTITTIFGEREFSTKEFAIKFGNAAGAKTLSELKRRGVVGRIRRGVYRCLAPSERPDLRRAEWERVRGAILRGPEPKAWAGPTAVEVWTEGRYRLATSSTLRVFEVAISARGAKTWAAYLRRNRISTSPTKRVGARVKLVRSTRLHRVCVRGEPVLPRETVERLIADHPALYGNAGDLLVHGP